MAIIDGIPGIKVTILSGEPGEAFNKHSAVSLNEYPDREEWARQEYWTAERSVNYLQCVSDAEFQIKIQLTPEFRFTSDAIQLRAIVDGKSIASTSFSQTARPNSARFIKGNWSRINPTEVLETPVKFRIMERVDDSDPDRIARDKFELAKGLGEITVRLDRLNYEHREHMEPKREGRTRQSRGLAILPDQVPKGIDEITEKALKGRAMSHSVGYGESVLVSSAISNRKSNTKTVYIDGRNKPIGIYLFKYRSREALHSELIIPRSPSPEPEGIILSHRSSNIGISKSRVAKIAELESQLEAVKNEEVKDEPQSQKIKSDYDDMLTSGRVYKTSRKRNGRIVVDLTDD